MGNKYILLGALLVFSVSCTKDDFAEAYGNPERIDATTVDKQFTGVIMQGQDFIVPGYTNYFVVLRSTLTPWTQTIGWVNSPNQYIPGSSGVNSFWDNYYSILAQYRELQNVYDALDLTKQEDSRIFYLAATVYMHYETQRAVDAFGMLPYFDAGKISANGGDYVASYAKFDQGSDIYTFMLDDLAKIADEMRGMTLSANSAASFRTQDIINNGDIELWQRFTNSLRIRMLMRVVEAPGFASRAMTEMSAIVSAPEQYPTIENNDQNVMIDVFNPDSPISARGFEQGINSAGWDGNDASKVMIDLLKASNDPRLEILFEPGTEAVDSVFTGLDPTLNATEQQSLINNGFIAYYNRRTFSENENFPGLLFSAAEMSFLLSEYRVRNNEGAAAVDAYNTGIRQSIDFYLYINSISSANNGVAVASVSDEAYQGLIKSEVVVMMADAADEEKLRLIGQQKWLNFNIIQPYQNWAEVRRLDYPELTFQTDNSSIQTLPPNRWAISGRESSFNPNYGAVSEMDKINAKLFWDVD